MGEVTGDVLRSVIGAHGDAARDISLDPTEACADRLADWLECGEATAMDGDVMADDLGVEVIERGEDPARRLPRSAPCWRQCPRAGRVRWSGWCRRGRWPDTAGVDRARVVGSRASAAARGCGRPPVRGHAAAEPRPCDVPRRGTASPQCRLGWAGQQTVRRHRATACTGVYHRDAMDGMVERRARKTPDAADALHAVVLGGGRRDRRAHLRDLAR